MVFAHHFTSLPLQIFLISPLTTKIQTVVPPPSSCCCLLFSDHYHLSQGEGRAYQKAWNCNQSTVLLRRNRSRAVGKKPAQLTVVLSAVGLSEPRGLQMAREKCGGWWACENVGKHTPWTMVQIPALSRCLRSLNFIVCKLFFFFFNWQGLTICLL